MNPVQTAITAIYRMNSDEINQVIDAIKLRRTQLARSVTRSLMVGDVVTFEARGRTVVGKVTKVNTKTLVVREEPRAGGLAGTNWKVTASLVSLVETA